MLETLNEYCANWKICSWLVVLCSVPFLYQSLHIERKQMNINEMGIEKQIRKAVHMNGEISYEILTLRTPQVFTMNDWIDNKLTSNDLNHDNWLLYFIFLNMNNKSWLVLQLVAVCSIMENSIIVRIRLVSAWLSSHMDSIIIPNIPYERILMNFCLCFLFLFVSMVWHWSANTITLSFGLV